MHTRLIVPPSGFQLDERVFPMLGVLKVAASLEAAGRSVDVLDLSGVEDVARVVEQSLDRECHYGITATTPQLPAAMQAVVVIRRVQPKARIVLGGSHVTLVNAAAKRGVPRAVTMLAELQQRFDVLVAGDGEQAAFAAFGDRIPSAVIDADDPLSSFWLTVPKLAETKWAARHLIDLASYRYTLGDVPTTSVIGQLGCPMACNFCGGRNSPTYRRMRVRPASDVAGELAHLYERYGYLGFMFLDDELNISKSLFDMLQAITDVQQTLGVRFKMRGLVKAELFTDEQALAMVEAGFVSILSGFESGSNRMLANMKKGATVEDNSRCLRIARKHGLKVKACMSLGHPGESRASIRMTRDWLLAERPDDFDAAVITVYPGCPYFDEATQMGEQRWTYTAKVTGDALYARAFGQFEDTPYYKGVPGSYEAFVSTDALSEADLVRERDGLEHGVRAALKLPYPSSAAERQFEHSMGAR